ncbi:MAG: hypothetical protein QOE70_4705 [Chthoniobacter sp.]|jgi:methyl-accepting chemotaxis protein|nr:hypothetical protein [Chthoniobacter sp.]
MQVFTNLSTQQKLVFGFGLMVALLAAVVATAYHGLSAASALDETLVDMWEIRSGINGQRASLFSALLVPTPEEAKPLLVEIKEYIAGRDPTFLRLQQQYQSDEKLRRFLRDLAAEYDAFSKIRDEQVIPKITDGKGEEAKAVVNGELQQHYQKMRAHARSFSSEIERRSVEQVAATRVRIGAISALALVAAVVLVMALTRLIARPLVEVTAVAERIALGDVNTRVKINARTDEVGALTQAFDRMRKSLRQLADRATQIAAGDLTARLEPQSRDDVLGTAFATMTANLRNVMGELVEAVNVLASATAQISAASSEMAASAAETASAVTETTATVEEVKHASGTSSETARHVSDQAQAVADVSQSGKKSVEDVIAGMALIRQHMESVAGSILSLNAQSQTIGEIIASVDDLATQSKMLAINASMEAAKAGSEGKGFAVVAQEVKSLAEQSRQATTRVRSILTQIEKATSSAVLTAEQGSKSVEAGVLQSTAAGNSIAALADSVARAAQATTQIAAASHEQFVGMDQVVLAMENIQKACARTAAGTRQAEAAAQRLNELGRKLKGLVGNFKV